MSNTPAPAPVPFPQDPILPDTSTQRHNVPPGKSA